MTPFLAALGLVAAACVVGLSVAAILTPEDGDNA